MKFSDMKEYKMLEASFLDWVDESDSSLSIAGYQHALAESTALLPEAYCEHLGIPLGSTIGHAVRSLIPVYCEQTGTEYLLSTRIEFPSEQESLSWWLRHRDHPDRVSLAAKGNGEWQLTIAG